MILVKKVKNKIIDHLENVALYQKRKKILSDLQKKLPYGQPLYLLCLCH